MEDSGKLCLHLHPQKKKGGEMGQRLVGQSLRSACYLHGYAVSSQITNGPLEHGYERL